MGLSRHISFACICAILLLSVVLSVRQASKSSRKAGSYVDKSSPANRNLPATLRKSKSFDINDKFHAGPPDSNERGGAFEDQAKQSAPTSLAPSPPSPPLPSDSNKGYNPNPPSDDTAASSISVQHSLRQSDSFRLHSNLGGADMISIHFSEELDSDAKASRPDHLDASAQMTQRKFQLQSTSLSKGGWSQPQKFFLEREPSFDAHQPTDHKSTKWSVSDQSLHSVSQGTPDVTSKMLLSYRQRGQVHLVEFQGQTHVMKVYDLEKLKDYMADGYERHLRFYQAYWSDKLQLAPSGSPDRSIDATSRSMRAKVLYLATGSGLEGLGSVCGPRADSRHDRRPKLAASFENATHLSVLLTYDKDWHRFYSHYDRLIGFRVPDGNPINGNIADDFAFSMMIGSGAFGVVNGAKRLDKAGLPAASSSSLTAAAATPPEKVIRKRYAVKSIYMDGLAPEKKEKWMACIEREVAIMMLCEGLPFLPIFDADYFEPDDDTIRIVMDLIPGVTLYDFMKRAPRSWLTESLLWRILAQLVLHVDALHARGILHRDLKPENVMISSKYWKIRRILKEKTYIYTDDDGLEKEGKMEVPRVQEISFRRETPTTPRFSQSQHHLGPSEVDLLEVERQVVVHLIDLGLSKVTPELTGFKYIGPDPLPLSASTKETIVGSLHFFPPEIATTATAYRAGASDGLVEYTTKVDIWSIRLLALEYLMGPKAFRMDGHQPSFESINLASPSMPFVLEPSQNLRAFLSMTLHPDKGARASTQDLLAFPMIQANLPKLKDK